MTPPLRIVRGNRMEDLAGELARVLELPSGAPLDPEWIVVPGRGMGVWLSMQLARHHGVSANLRRLHPRELVETAMRGALEDEDALDQRWSKDRLVWAVLALLEARAEIPELAVLSRLLADDPTGRHTHQLARQITLAFDRYLTYRPELVRAWERGDDDGVEGEPLLAWQPFLWRRLCGKLGRRHVAALEPAFHAAATGAVPGLPRRLAVFGLSGLPPLYARVLCRLAHGHELHWFHLAPSYSRAERRPPDPSAPRLRDTNPLLGSLGRPAADFERVLAAACGEVGVRHEWMSRHREPERASLLGRLQADLLHAADPRDPPIGVSASDRSLCVHSCHGAMREVEVMHDQLLDAVAGSGDVEPHEVAVLVSDLETYAPYIEAVFERDREDPTSLPYRIADRPLRRDAPVLDALWRIFGLVGSRLRASEVVDLLNLDAVRRRFELSAADVDRISGWIVEANVRWGADAAHREAHGQPPLAENTWRFGLDRLLLGLALAGRGRATFAGVLPFDDVEGQDGALVGSLAEICERLFGALDELARPRPLAEWREPLARTLDALLARDRETAWQHDAVLAALGELAEAARDAGHSAPVSAGVLASLLEQRLDERHAERGFLAGGITFCAMVPMRAIPFRVLGLLGMSDGAFPRPAHPNELDLVERGDARRLPGDRDRRDDDRHLFLEALLSARERLIVTYSGQSVRDDASLPPSVVLAELLDVLPERVRAQVVVRHPLQSFSRRYFDGSDARLFSHASPELARAAFSRRARREAPRLFTGPLPAADAAPGAGVGLDELARFFENPIGWLLGQRMGIELRERDHDVPDREPLELDGLDRYELGSTLLELLLDGVPEPSLPALLTASGRLPPGALGVLALERELASARPIVEQILRERGARRREPLTLAERLPDGTLLSGEISERWTSAQVLGNFARVSARRVIGAWIRHLGLCLAAPEPERRTLLVGRPAKGDGALAWRFRPVPDAATHLADLIELFRTGCRQPLLLVPEASLAFAEALHADRPRDAALSKARGAWHDERAFNPWIVRVVGDGAEPPFAGASDGPGFEALAERLLLPLLRHREKA
jgi:exodeoxyribonuclease V gamma subunit